MLLSKYRDAGFNIVAFPCNQFGKQEPGNNEAIKHFANTRGFKGILMDKVEVNGKHASEVFNFLKRGSGDESALPWNFTKFLIGKDGRVRGRFPPTMEPHELVAKIEELLAEEPSSEVGRGS